MGKKRKRTFGEDLDWYLIPIEKVKQVVLVIVVITLAGAGGYLGYNHFKSPKTRARIAIKNAQNKADSIAQRPDFTSTVRQAYRSVQEKIQEAQRLFNSQDYAGAEQTARDALQEAKILLSGIENRPADAKIMRLEGKVEIQRKGQGMWETAKARDDLYEGDFVKTSKHGAVEITVGNMIVKLGPDTLYEVTGKKDVTPEGRHTVKMWKGDLNIFTQNSGAGVDTPFMKAELQRQTHAEINLDERNRGEATIIHGKDAKVKVGDQEYALEEKERLRTAGKHVLEKTKILESPRILSPADNQSFSLTSKEGACIEWEKIQGAATYNLQLSKTSFFSRLLPNGDIIRRKTKLCIQIPAVGDYYCRVRAVDASGQKGAFSNFKRFRIVNPADVIKVPKKKPDLRIESLQVLSNQCIVKGWVESGATVEINGERVEVKPDGSFIQILTFTRLGHNEIKVKARNETGGVTVKTEYVDIQEY